MNTPAHVILAMAAFGRRTSGRVTAAAALGGLTPDIPLYAMSGWALGVSGVSAAQLFDVLYFSPSWQAMFAIDHALPLWAAALALSVLFREPVSVAFAGGGLLHAVADFLVHHDDARRQLWPFSDFVFRSPVSYWDPAHYGTVFAPVELAASLALCVFLWLRHRAAGARAAIVALGAAEAAPWLLWRLVF